MARGSSGRGCSRAGHRGRGGLVTLQAARALVAVSVLVLVVLAPTVAALGRGGNFGGTGMGRRISSRGARARTRQPSDGGGGGGGGDSKKRAPVADGVATVDVSGTAAVEVAPAVGDAAVAVGGGGVVSAARTHTPGGVGGTPAEGVGTGTPEDVPVAGTAAHALRLHAAGTTGTGIGTDTGTGTGTALRMRRCHTTCSSTDGYEHQLAAKLSCVVLAGVTGVRYVHTPVTAVEHIVGAGASDMAAMDAFMPLGHTFEVLQAALARGMRRGRRYAMDGRGRPVPPRVKSGGYSCVDPEWHWQVRVRAVRGGGEGGGTRLCVW